MPQVTGAFSSYQAKANREDLTNAIYNISPADTPFISAIGRTKASGTKHEWQTDALDPVNRDNAVVEGNRVPGSTSRPTTRVSGYCQISEKDVVVTATQEAVDHAGIDSMMAYQLAKKSKSLKVDMEAILTGTQGEDAGSDATPRKTRALESWLSTNVNRASDGANAPNAASAPVDGTQRDFTEALLKDVLQKVYNSGGDASVIMVGTANKANLSMFPGRATARQNVSAATILGAASLYASDWGDLKVVPNRQQRDRSAFVLSPDYAAVSYLRAFATKDLAVTGDIAGHKLLNTEYCLEMRNEAAHGIVADLNTTIQQAP